MNQQEIEGLYHDILSESEDQELGKSYSLSNILVQNYAKKLMILEII